MLELRRSRLNTSEVKGQTEPTEQAFLSPGGASFEELAQLNLQRSDEFYNEFDFSEVSTCGSDPDPVTFSYGERISTSAAVDFEPFVHRAEQRAKRYHSFLKDLGETRSGALRIIHREWFLASNDFVMVHVCFES
ncbi:MAG TPA: hypothetical protein VF283_11980 [Bryobacteraceae bacterium]